MSVIIKPQDVTKVKCDVIVNSLGIKKNIAFYGAICRSIVKAAKSKELDGTIKSWEYDARPGAYFITGGYALPSSKIIHVVTPLYKKDKELLALEYVYKLILITAYDNGWKKIAMPIIGTGSNGYPHAYVLKMLTKLVKAFDDSYEGMEITICLPIIRDKEQKKPYTLEKVDYEYREFLSKNNELNDRDFYYDKDSFESFNYSSINYLLEYSSKDIERCGNLDYKLMMLDRRQPLSKGKPSSINEQQSRLDWLLEHGKRPAIVDLTQLKLQSVTNYIDAYLSSRYGSQNDIKIVRKHMYDIVGGSDNYTSIRSKHNSDKRRTTLPLSMLMRYILALHMTLEEAKHLLLFCSRALSPVAKQDLIYTKFIEDKIYDTYSVNGFCLKAKVDQIFGYEKIAE